jgi:hypothetical protein
MVKRADAVERGGRRLSSEERSARRHGSKGRDDGQRP